MDTTPRTVSGHLSQDVAHLVAGYRKQAVGRGPTRTQVFFRQNVIVIVMQDNLTEGERLLVAGGDRQMVVHARLRLQELMRDRLVAGVEELTGCKVEAFMSTNHVEPDLAAELFILDRPVPGEATGATA